MTFGNRRGQAAERVVAPGATEGGKRHRGSDQWLYVIGGSGMAIVAGKRQRLGPGMLVLIERDDAHEIRNTGRVPLQPLNVYVPPAQPRAAIPSRAAANSAPDEPLRG